MIPNGILRKYVTDLMGLFCEVRWDRCAGDADAGVVFGWIDREDSKSDFVLIRWDNDAVGFTTSSAEYSAEYARRQLGTDETHIDCQRVEFVFPEVQNVIRLGGTP